MIHLRLGDCLEIMPTLADASFDAIIADIPYGTTACKWDTVIPFAPMWAQLKRLAKPKAAIVLFGSQPFTSALVMSNVKMFKHDWVWIKNKGGNFANTGREPFKEHESILVFSNGGWTYNKQMQDRIGSHFGKSRKKQSTIPKSDNYGKFERPPSAVGVRRVPSSWQRFICETGLHPTQKPVALLEYLVRTYTNEGDTVLDFTAGSGTLGVACVNTNRNVVLIEKDAGYFEIAKRRVSDAQKQMLLPLGASGI